MSTLIAIGDAAQNGGDYSPTKEEAVNRGIYNGCLPLLHRRMRHLLGSFRFRILFSICLLWFLAWFRYRIGSFMSWNPHYPSSVYSPSRGEYTVLINTWKRNSLLKQTVAHYTSCRGADAIHVVWSESNPPSEAFKTYLKNIVSRRSGTAHKPNLRFDINEEDNLNNSVWQSAPLTMVGFVPRMHWLAEEHKNSMAYFKYGGWWSVWWMGTYSTVLSKAAFFHRKYLDLYTFQMPKSILEYVTIERNCEDIAMSLLVANTTNAPPIWVKGKIYEIGSSGISSLRGHIEKRNRCVNDFISLYGTMPLVSTNVKAGDARHQWVW